MPSSSSYQNRKSQKVSNESETIVVRSLRRSAFCEDNGTIRLPPVRNQALAADDVAQHVVRLTGRDAQDEVVELAGPEKFQLVDMVRNIMETKNNSRPVIEDHEARYIGSKIDETA